MKHRNHCTVNWEIGFRSIQPNVERWRINKYPEHQEFDSNLILIVFKFWNICRKTKKIMQLFKSKNQKSGITKRSQPPWGPTAGQQRGVWWSSRTAWSKEWSRPGLSLCLGDTWNTRQCGFFFVVRYSIPNTSASLCSVVERGIHTTESSSRLSTFGIGIYRYSHLIIPHQKTRMKTKRFHIVEKAQKF